MSFSFQSIGHAFASAYGKLKTVVDYVMPIVAKIASNPIAAPIIEDLTAQIPVAGPELARIEQALMGNALAYMHAKAAGQDALPAILTPDIEAALQPLLAHLSPQMQDVIKAFEAQMNQPPVPKSS